jgi:hypothetical protein
MMLLSERREAEEEMMRGRAERDRGQQKTTGTEEGGG